ncbi:BnaUnng01780D [Brassica napus]|uniref:BnaUnng01780D protein n=3 Tax=Brassica TaxID=3705 RepID=A0A078JNP7_BRANA|nr:BnaUnng01780D [Brassica napus]
MLQVGGLPAKT